MNRPYFDRDSYLENAIQYEANLVDDVSDELSEFSDDIEDIALELAYTRYAYAKIESIVQRLAKIPTDDELLIDNEDPHEAGDMVDKLIREARELEE